MATLSRAVGRGVDKPLKRDVLLVQQRLNWHRPTMLPRIAEDGGQGDETFTAIDEFQARVLKMSHPDGRVDPGGRTWLALDEPAPAGPPRLSEKGRALLRQLENLFLYTYDDQTGDKIDGWVKGATIGYGHLIPKTEWTRFKNGINSAEAAALLDDDLKPFEAAVNVTITVPLTEAQFDALTILTFNIGGPNLARSSVAKMVNDPTAKTTYKTLEAAWKSWNRSQGKVMLGLDRRRQCEWNVYTQGKYEKFW